MGSEMCIRDSEGSRNRLRSCEIRVESKGITLVVYFSSLFSSTRRLSAVHSQVGARLGRLEAFAGLGESMG